MYNSFDLMDKYFDSLNRQKYQDFEVIIVDDCSSDDSYSRLMEYAKNSKLDIIVCQTEKNAGPGNARNIGMERASGEWLTFIDNDDWVSDDFLLKIEDVLHSNDVHCVIYDYYIGDKYMVLGVAFGWGKRKGLDVFVDLAKRLDGNKYQIVLVGTDDDVDRQLPKQILSIHRTQDQTELAEIYTAADVFANPTREEVFGLVNVEALACGTPGITFDTGGSPECYDVTCGSVVPRNDVDAMEREIVRICETRPYSMEDCQTKAKSFDKTEKFREYVELYEELNGQT